MGTLPIAAKGQIAPRKEFLMHVGVKPGDKIDIDKRPDGRIEVKAAQRIGGISDVFDCLKRENGPALSIEDMNRIAAQGWAGEG